MSHRRIIFSIIVLFFAAGLLALPAHASGVEIVFNNVDPAQEIQLQVGGTYAFIVEVEADQPFISALLISDEQFPGRGVFLNGADIAVQTDAATLSLTATGKSATADLPGGVAPVSLVVGVRYPGGIVFSERVDFTIRVEEP